MATVQFADGTTAELKDEDELTNKDVKTLRRAARRVGALGAKLKELGMDSIREEGDEGAALAILGQLSDEEDDSIDLFQRTCVVVRLKDWTVGRDLPTTADEVDELPRSIYGPLTRAAADINLVDEYSEDGALDPKADTAS